MAGPINFSDLFDKPSIDAGLGGLKEQIRAFGNDIKKEMQAVRESADLLSSSMSGTSSASKGGRDNTKEQAANAEKLYQAYQQLSAAAKALAPALEGIATAEERVNKIQKLAIVANNEYANSIDRIKAVAELSRVAIDNMGSATANTNAQSKQFSATVSTLTNQAKNYAASQKASAKAAKDSASATQKVISESVNLGEAYRSLSVLCAQTGVNLDSLVSSERTRNAIIKNGITANKALSGSYNQLSAQYNLVKAVLNEMSDEMRKNINIGGVWEQKALSLMDKMKAMQEATGKHTLSVGDYSKAFNGLRLSTQQVLREMPTLANSLQQFFIAISNNVPIFLDNFKRASEELGGFSKAFKMTMQTVLSGQTFLLILLTVLPKIAKAIHDKRKAQQEANKATKEAVVLEKLLAEAELSVEKAIAQDVVKVSILSTVLEDNTRSVNDRTLAARALKSEFEEELANFSEEQIVAGKAKEAIDELTQSIKVQAEARAIMNKMVEYYNKVLDNEATIKTAENSYEAAKAITASAQAQRDAVYSLNNMGEAYARVEGALNKAKEAEQKALDELNKARADTETYGEAIEELYKKIPLDGLITKTRKVGGTIKETVMEIPSYYNEMLEALVSTLEDGFRKEVAAYDLHYKEQKEKMLEQQEALQDMLESASKDERKIISEQLKWLTIKMLAADAAYANGREKLIREHFAIYNELSVEEEDLDAEALAGIKNTLSMEKNLRDRAAAMDYSREMEALQLREHNAYEEVALKEKLNADLLDSERQYWEDFKTRLEQEGLELTDIYVEVMKKLASYTETPSSQTDTHKKRGGRIFRNLTEVAFAYSNQSGEQAGEGFFNRKIKDDYLDFSNSVNEALQSSINSMYDWMDARIAMAEVAVKAAEEEAESAKSALNIEMQARANGYANNVELARREYEDKLRLQKQAMEEQQRLQRIQEGIDTAQQVSSLITATANLWSSYSKIPLAGPGLAIAATALMWGSFLASKITAAQVAGKTTYGEGMAEYLDYGGSHASGKDIDFGRTKDGKRRTVERGEVVGVINRKNVAKYGAENVVNIIRALNSGTFEKEYPTTITSGQLLDHLFGIPNTAEQKASSLWASNRLSSILSNPTLSEHSGIAHLGREMEANYAVAFNGGDTDLSAIEQGLRELISQGSVKVVPTPYGRIEYRGNTKRIIKDA